MSMKRMEGYTLREELSSELWRATSEDGAHVLVKFPKDCTSLSALSLVRREYEMGLKLKDIKGVHAPIQVLEGNDLVGLLYDDCGGELFSNHLSSFCTRLVVEPVNAIQDFLNIAINLAHLMEEVHYKGVILGVLQPDNIILGPNGALLYDFALASSSPSNTADIVGCDLRYISPEATGRTQHSVDNRSDLYSLGISLFHLLTGRPPFQLDTDAALVYAHIAKKPISVTDVCPGVPEVLSQIIAKLLNKSPTERYQSSYGLKWDLEQCLATMRENTIREFPLGTHDKMRKFTLPTILFGRDKELTLLRGDFEKVNQGSSSLTFISGHSGIGKTSLIQTAQQNVSVPRFFYISGKFDQVNKFIPYSAFLQAATDLLRQILAMSEGMVETYKHKLIEALGPNAQVIIEVVPLLELIIGHHDPAPELPPIESQTRFDSVFQDFLQVFAHRESPLILFLDDLQWADSSTLRLLKLIAANNTTSYMALIAAYRDNEVSATHATGKMITECKNTIQNVRHIELGPLDLDTLNTLVNTAFPAVNTCELAEVVLKKTEGNPFFVLQFLKTIHNEGMLRFDSTSQTWFWELSNIQTICSTSNVVEFMVQTLNKLDNATQNVLAHAACLGNIFHLQYVSIACNQTPQKTCEDLDKALRGEYVMRLDDVHFKFVHDRVQQAALNLTPEAKRAERQLTIGRRLLKGLNKSTMDQFLFDLVSLLNSGSSLVTDKAEKVEIARLNLAAGLKAKSSAAFGPALVYLQAASNLIGKDFWDADYSFTFTLKLALSECEFLNGSLEEGDAIAQEVLAKAVSRTDKCSVYKVLVQHYGIAGDYVKSVGLGLSCLDTLYGVSVNMKPSAEEVAEVYNEVKQQLLALPSVYALASAPEASDPKIQECFQIGGPLIAPSFFLSIDLLTVFLSRMLMVSIKEGTTAQSPMIMTWFAAFVAGSRYEDFQLGYDLGKVGLQLNERYKEPASTMVGYFLFGDFINYWKAHLSTDVAYLQKSYKGAIEVGDQAYACFSSCHLFAVNFMIATPLKEALAIMDPSSNYVHATKYGELDDVHITLKMSNMAAQELGVETFREPTYRILEERLHTRSPCAQSYHYIFKMMVQCILGDFEGAVISGQHSEQVLPGCFGHCFRVYHFFFYNVALSEVNEVGSPELEKVLSIMEANQKEIKVYSDVSEENFLHLYLISQAGIEKLRGNYTDAIEFLGDAAESASAGGFTHMRGLANELAAEILLMRKKHKAAEVYIIEALTAYEQYGAFAKVSSLSEKYPTLQWRKVVAKSTQNSLGSIDFHSVLTASHSLSEEIVLSKLLSKLMNITMENAGAERGYLLLPKPDERDVLWTAAESIDDNVLIHVSENSEVKPQVCEGIINYVKRTLTSVVLANACNDKLWRTDPYVVATRTKSVLCIPFARQGTLEAILYLENNLTEGAFTTDLVNVLNLLAAQAAISIQNANMYMHMQKAKEQAQHAIQAQRQLSEFLPLIVYSLKLDGQMEYINQRWCTYTGLSLEKSLGYQWMRFLHPDDYDNIASAIAASGKTCKDLDIEFRLKKSDGTYRWHLLRAEARTGDNKESIGWFGTFLDIEDRKQIEEINKADQAKSRFLASMSHEMRTPLSGVIGMASLLRITPLTSEQTDMVHTISMCSELLLVLINNILDIFKLEEKQVTLEKLEISPLECAEKSIDIITVPANDKRIDVVLDFDEDVPQLIIGDSHRLQQIFTNLLGNAVKFTPEGGEIVVRASIDKRPREEDNLVHLLFSVQDSGVGVPPEGESKLFQLFSQCDTSTTRVFGGTGLGLAISKRLVEMMNGEIWYENRGKGATFVFSVATRRVESPLVSPPPEPKISSVYLSGRANSLRSVIQSKLRSIGAEVTVGEKFESSMVNSHTCTIVVDGEDVDWTQQSFAPGSHVLALSRDLQTSTKPPQGLSFLRKPIKFRRLMQYLSKIATAEVEEVAVINASCELAPSDLATPLRILLADDNEMNQKVALKLLQSIGYSNVKVAGNGAEALQLLEKSQFDVILMDMEMPIMDGCQATSIIRSTMPTRAVHIISMTANAFPEDWSRCASAGMCTYLPKPVKRDTLSAELNKAVLVRAGKHACTQCQCAPLHHPNGHATMNGHAAMNGHANGNSDGVHVM